jgi:hypothetical protein
MNLTTEITDGVVPLDVACDHMDPHCHAVMDLGSTSQICIASAILRIEISRAINCIAAANGVSLSCLSEARAIFL